MKQEYTEFDFRVSAIPSSLIEKYIPDVHKVTVIL